MALHLVPYRGAGPGPGIQAHGTHALARSNPNSHAAGPVGLPREEHKGEISPRILQVFGSFREADLKISERGVKRIIDTALAELRKPSQPHTIVPKIEKLAYKMEIFREGGSASVYVFYPNAKVIESGSVKNVTRAVRLIIENRRVIDSEAVARAGVLVGNKPPEKIAHSIKNFCKEARRLNQIKQLSLNNPVARSICQLYDASPAALSATETGNPDDYSMYMKLYGLDLYSLISMELPDDRLMPLLPRIFNSSCMQVAFLHDKDIIHKDIKAENIFCSGTHDVALADFGTSTICSYELMPPENVPGKDSTKAYDVWALGNVFLALLNNFDTPWAELLRLIKNLSLFQTELETPESKDSVPAEKVERKKVHSKVTVEDVQNLCVEISKRDFSCLGTYLPLRNDPLCDLIKRLEQIILTTRQPGLAQAVGELIQLLKNQLQRVWAHLEREVDARVPMRLTDEVNETDFLRNIVAPMLHPNPEKRIPAKQWLQLFSSVLERLAAENEEMAFDQIKKSYEENEAAVKTLHMSRGTVEKVCTVAREAYKSNPYEVGKTCLDEGRDVYLIRLEKSDEIPAMDIFQDGFGGRRVYLKENPVIGRGSDKEFSPEFFLKVPKFGNPVGLWVAGLSSKSIASHMREIAILEKLQDTPQSRFFPNVFDDFHSDGVSIQKQELGDISLADFRKQGDRTMSPWDHKLILFRVATGLCNQLIGLEAADVVHADIRQSNLLFDQNWDCLMTDFGSANSAKSSCFIVSPERWKEGISKGALPLAQRKDDIWAAGLILADFLNNTPYHFPRWQYLLMMQHYIDQFKKRSLEKDKNELKESGKVSAIPQSSAIAQLQGFDSVLREMSPIDMAALHPVEKVDKALLTLWKRSEPILKSLQTSEEAIQVVTKLNATLTGLIDITFEQLKNVVSEPIHETEDDLFGMIRKLVYAMLHPDPSQRANMDTVKRFAAHLKRLDTDREMMKARDKAVMESRDIERSRALSDSDSEDEATDTNVEPRLSGYDLDDDDEKAVV